MNYATISRFFVPANSNPVLMRFSGYDPYYRSHFALIICHRYLEIPVEFFRGFCTGRHWLDNSPQTLIFPGFERFHNNNGTAVIKNTGIYPREINTLLECSIWFKPAYKSKRAYKRYCITAYMLQPSL
jgi:hypothetical protein